MFPVQVLPRSHFHHLEQDARPVAADNPEEDVPRRPMKGYFKAKQIAIEGKRSPEVGDDKAAA
jgi:hypothetical protein